MEQNATLLLCLYKTLIFNLKMQNIVEANNKFEKFLMPIFTKLSVDNRMVSNYRMFLNKELTIENINEIKKRINVYFEHLLDIIAYNLHKSSENPENFFNFVNRRNIIKEFDMRKIEIIFPEHFEMILKNSNSNCLRDHELAELNDLEAQMFSYIRLGNDCENYNKNSNNKKCVAKNNNNFNGFSNNQINNGNNSNYFLEETSVPNYNNFKINNNFSMSSYSLINNQNNINNSNNNFKNPLDCRNKIECIARAPNFKSNNGFSNEVKRESDFNFKSIREFSPSKNQNLSISEKKEVKLIININEEKNNISLKKPNEARNIFFEVVQGNNASTFNGKENKIEKNTNKEALKSKKNTISNANETLNHFLKEKFQEKNQKNNLLNAYNNYSLTHEEEISLNPRIYNSYLKEDQYKTACEVESYLNSEHLEGSSISNTNYYSNLNTFIDKTKTGLPLSYPNPSLNENIEDFVMFIENQKDFEFYNPLTDIFKEDKQDLTKNKTNIPLDNSKSKITHNSLKNNRAVPVSENNNNRDVNCNPNFANIDIFFEKNKDINSDSTGGDFEREMNSMDDDFSHVCSDIDSIKKEKSKNKMPNKHLEEQILRDPNSNYNYYSRQCIPKSNKKSEKFKNMIPFLREFNPKFLKKENIDKKILRKFRNFVKSFLENDLSGKIYSRFDSKHELLKAIALEHEKFKDLVFLKKFYKQNLLPPMNYNDDSNNINIEFKSFNTNYMLWLFSQDGISEIYKLFTDNLGNEILNDFVESYSLEFVNKKNEIGIIQTLKDYIFSIEKIYTTSKAKGTLRKKPAESNLLAKNPEISSIHNEYAHLNSELMTNRKNLISANQKKQSSEKRIVLDYEIVYQKNRSNTITSEDIFDKCIDDLEIKNQSMILDFYNGKREEKNKQVVKILTNKDLNEPFKMWNFENNDEIGNLRTDKKLIGKIVNEDQMYFEGSNNHQLENFNYFY